MPDLDVTGVSAVTLADDDGLLIIDQSTGSVKKALAGRLSRDYGQIRGAPLALAGFQTIAAAASANVVAGGSGNFFTAASGLERGITATPASGILVPSRTGIYRCWYSITATVTGNTPGTFDLTPIFFLRYNGTPIVGGEATLAQGTGDHTYSNNDGFPFTLSGETVVDITTASQNLTLACTMTKLAGTETGFNLTALYCTLGMERLDDT